MMMADIAVTQGNEALAHLGLRLHVYHNGQWTLGAIDQIPGDEDAAIILPESCVAFGNLQTGVVMLGDGARSVDQERGE